MNCKLGKNQPLTNPCNYHHDHDQAGGSALFISSSLKTQYHFIQFVDNLDIVCIEHLGEYTVTSVLHHR